jgi:hypothetical protein
MEKKVILWLFFAVLLTAIVSAQGEKMGVSTIKDTYVAGENITFKVALLDSSDNPLDANVNVMIEDAEKRRQVETSVPSNKVVSADIGATPYAGYWKITASYTSSTGEKTESTALFMVELNELAKFDIKDNVLTVINTGNTRYTKSIQIVIGETIGTKEVDLGVGESVTFRLVAPSGDYNIRVSDGKTTITQGGVALTGNVIGVLDNRELSRSPVTGGINPEGDSGVGNLTKTPSRSFVYVFLFVIFGAAILLVIERRYRKNVLVNYQLKN